MLTEQVADLVDKHETLPLDKTISTNSRRMKEAKQPKHDGYSG